MSLPKSATAEKLAGKVAGRPALLNELLVGLRAPDARTRFGCAKALRLLSQEHPELLYPQFDFFAGLLRDQNKIFQWEAARILAELARVDLEDKFSRVFKRYFAPIPGPVMITAATVIRCGPKLCQAKPELAGRIVTELLKVERARYQTAECRNVAIGHAIVALSEMQEQLADPGPVEDFVRRQLKNPRPATRRKAEVFLRGMSKSLACKTVGKAG